MAATMTSHVDVMFGQANFLFFLILLTEKMAGKIEINLAHT